MLKIMDEEKLEICKYLLADKGYDDTKIIEYLEKKDINPIIDICNKWLCIVNDNVIVYHIQVSI